MRIQHPVVGGFSRHQLGVQRGDRRVLMPTRVNDSTARTEPTAVINFDPLGVDATFRRIQETQTYCDSVDSTDQDHAGRRLPSPNSVRSFLIPVLRSPIAVLSGRATLPATIA